MISSVLIGSLVSHPPAERISYDGFGNDRQIGYELFLTTAYESFQESAVTIQQAEDGVLKEVVLLVHPMPLERASILQPQEGLSDIEPDSGRKSAEKLRPEPRAACIPGA